MKGANMDVMSIAIPRQVGLYVRRAREAQGLTRRQLAHAAGVSERLLASLELGDAQGIRLDKLMAVLAALKLSLMVQGEGIAPKGYDGASPSDMERGVLPSNARGTRASGSERACDVPEASRIQQPFGYDQLLRTFLRQDVGLDIDGHTKTEMSEAFSVPPSDGQAESVGMRSA